LQVEVNNLQVKLHRQQQWSILRVLSPKLKQQCNKRQFRRNKKKMQPSCRLTRLHTSPPNNRLPLQPLKDSRLTASNSLSIKLTCSQENNKQLKIESSKIMQ